MFKKLLIANRGEIAVRIISACKELGIHTVAVYSQADKGALHARVADEAICIGPANNSESYLSVPAIISAAEITDVDAIHPGYGFLAESAHFAEICQACGITFVGPSPDMIKLMGDKVLARERIAKAGLPVLQGTDKITEAKMHAKIAKQIGYPIMIKAAAGGGGKGMRIARSREELGKFLELAQAEAHQTFGSAEVYLEKYLEHPRHIEFQIIADNYGNIIHLGERECSIQRRHQKLVEEAPSPFLDREKRQQIGELVVRAIKAVNYSSVGTVEFLFDERGHFFFIEMNTRIQVEHGITELVTGVDIVKEQIKIAAGEKLMLTQDRVKLQGHSIECRINAECPETFAPSPGPIDFIALPTGPGIRVDSAMHSSSNIPPLYDSLVAKIMSYGQDRPEAIVRMARALDMTRIEGIKTLLPLHKKILRDPDFIAGNLSTAFLDKFMASPVKAMSSG